MRLHTLNFSRTVVLLIFIISALMPVVAHTPNFESNIPDVGQSGAWAIDSHQERLMGNMMMEQITASDFITSDTVVNDYLYELSAKLQASAPPIDFKLQFFCVDSSVLNAFAFFGGYVAVHSGLILAAETESELAAVLAHETAHITQRHLARILTNNKKMMPLTVAEIIGALAIGTLGGSPEAGMHLANAALGGHIQNLINYTRIHEQEADRLGIQILSKAGFDPHGMARMFHKLSAKNQYQTKPPEYLLTHPMFEDRIADASNRAEKMVYHKKPDNLFFQLIRARLVATSQENAKRRVQRLTQQLKSEPSLNKTPLEYALALSLSKNRQYSQAEILMLTLSERHPDQWLFRFGLGEIAREKGDIDHALNCLKTLYEKSPNNYALSIYYADTLMDAKQIKAAKEILLKQQKAHAHDANLLQLLARAHGLSGAKVDLHQTQAEWHVLRGEHREAFQQFDLALEYEDKKSYRASQILARKKELQSTIKEVQKLK